MIFALIIGLASCGNGVNIANAKPPLLKKVMTWKLIGIFFGVVTMIIILSGYLFNWLI